MLAVAIEEEDPGSAEAMGLGPALGEGVSLAGWGGVAEDDGAGIAGEGVGGVGGTVIDDDDGAGEREELADDVTDGAGFVEAWDDGKGIAWGRGHGGGRGMWCQASPRRDLLSKANLRREWVPRRPSLSQMLAR